MAKDALWFEDHYSVNTTRKEYVNLQAAGEQLSEHPVPAETARMLDRFSAFLYRQWEDDEGDGFDKLKPEHKGFRDVTTQMLRACFRTSTFKEEGVMSAREVEASEASTRFFANIKSREYIDIQAADMLLENLSEEEQERRSERFWEFMNDEWGVKTGSDLRKTEGQRLAGAARRCTAKAGSRTTV